MKESKYIPAGVSCLFSCTSNGNGDMTFVRSSQGATVLSENYIMTTLFHAQLKYDNFAVSGLFSEAIGKEIFVSYNCVPDLVTFGSYPNQGPTCILYFYDGYRWHVEDVNNNYQMHQKECQYYDGNNGFENSTKYLETQKLTLDFERQMRVLLEDMYDHVYIVRESWCKLHNSCVIGEKEYDSPYSAILDISYRMPEMMIPVEFPKQFSLSYLLGELAAPATPDTVNYHSGFCTLSGYVPLEFRDKYFGQCLSRKFVCGEELLTPEFCKLMDSRLLAEHPGVPLETSRKIFLKQLLSTRKLVASHSFKNNTVSLSYLSYLRQNFNFVITRIDHILLFSLYRNISLQHMPLSSFVNYLQVLRDSITAKKNMLDSKNNETEIARLSVWSSIVKVKSVVTRAHTKTLTRPIVRR